MYKYKNNGGLDFYSDENDKLENYENRFERQLISRINKIDELKSKMDFALENVKGLDKTNFNFLKRTLQSILK